MFYIYRHKKCEEVSIFHTVDKVWLPTFDPTEQPLYDTLELAVADIKKAREDSSCEFTICIGKMRKDLSEVDPFFMHMISYDVTC